MDMMLWDEKLELDILCIESGVATGTDPTTPPPSLGLSLTFSRKLVRKSSSLLRRIIRNLRVRVRVHYIA